MAIVKNEVKLIEYKKSVDFLNCATHAVGAILGVSALILALSKTIHSDALDTLCAVVYCLTFIAVYLVSAIYHGLPQGEAKRRARLLDHSTIPFLIAGTATPCALITLYNLNHKSGIAVFCIGWFCVLFGVFAKLFFFEKLKTAVMVVYIVGSLVMISFALPYLKGSQISMEAFLMLVVGCAVYLFGGLFCWLGIKHEECHIIFHILVVLGSVIHYYAIFNYVLY